MKFLKSTVIIVVVGAFIIALAVTSFYVGVSVGKNRFQASIEQELRLKILNEVSARLGDIPGNVMTKTPTNILIGTLNEINANEVVLIASPQTMKEAVWQEPQTYKIKIDQETKIFYSTVNPDFIIESSRSLTIDHPIKATELKKDEYAYVQLDQAQPAGQYKALEIRVAR